MFVSDRPLAIRTTRRAALGLGAAGAARGEEPGSASGDQAPTAPSRHPPRRTHLGGGSFQHLRAGLAFYIVAGLLTLFFRGPFVWTVPRSGKGPRQRGPGLGRRDTLVA